MTPTIGSRSVNVIRNNMNIHHAFRKMFDKQTHLKHDGIIGIDLMQKCEILINLAD